MNRSGMMGFRELLLEINKLWKQKRAGLLQSAEQILSQIDTNAGNSEDKLQKRAGKAIDSGLPGQAAELFTRSFDKNYGGFGSAPKFPTPHNLIFLMLYSGIGLDDKWYQVEKTLEQMRRGGFLIILDMDFPDIPQTVFISFLILKKCYMIMHCS